MKFKINLTKKSLSDHFKYYVWVYVAAIVISTSFFNISTTMINNQAPPDQKLYSFVCGDAIAIDYFIDFHEEMTLAFPHLKVVACDNLAYNSMSTMAKEQKQKFLSLISISLINKISLTASSLSSRCFFFLILINFHQSIIL